MEWYSFNNTLFQCESTEDNVSSIMEWYPFNNNTLLQCESTRVNVSIMIDGIPSIIIHYFSVNTPEIMYLV